MAAGQWRPAGTSDAGASGSPILSARATRLLGARHRDTLGIRDNLAAALLASGRSRDGIEHYKRLAADTEAAAGRDHPDAITPTRSRRARLASAYRRGGKPKDAIALYQRTLADCERHLGRDHPLIRTVRDGLEAAARSGTRRP